MKRKPKPIIKIAVINSNCIRKFTDMLEKESHQFFKVEVKSINDFNEINADDINILVIFYAKKIEQQIKDYMPTLNSNIQQISILDEKNKIHDKEEYIKFNNVIIKQMKSDYRGFAFSVIYEFYKKYIQ